MSPKGHPQSGEDKICCGDRDFATRTCAPESCLISSGAGADKLPAMPFHAAIVAGKCKCFAPQVWRLECTCGEYIHRMAPEDGVRAKTGNDVAAMNIDISLH